MLYEMHISCITSLRDKLKEAPSDALPDTVLIDGAAILNI